MGGVNAVVGAGRKPKVKVAGDSDFDNVYDIDVPEYMLEMKYATSIWRATTKELLKRKILKITDLHNIEMFCFAYNNLREAQLEVVLYGVTIETAMGKIKNPAITVVNEASKQMAQFGSMLGLDPVSRNRLMGGGSKPKDNQFAKVLNM